MPFLLPKIHIVVSGAGVGGGSTAHKLADIGTARIKFASWNIGGFYG